jgi:hypothetical protein
MDPKCHVIISLSQEHRRSYRDKKVGRMRATCNMSQQSRNQKKLIERKTNM